MDMMVSSNLEKPYLVTVDWKPEVFCESTEMVRVKMSKEISCAAFNVSILEGINCKTSSYSKKGREASH